MRKSLPSVWIALTFFLPCANPPIAAQSADTVVFAPLGRFDFTLLYSGYTPLIDRLGRPFVYVAAKELGLVTFDMSNPDNPYPADTIPVSALGNLKATGVAQDSQYLFVSLGDFQGSGQTTGLAIYDVSAPAAPVLLDRWENATFDKGSSSVVLEGAYAYLSAMENGVLVLDVSNKTQIAFVQQIVPDSDFGNHQHTYHARGLFIRNDTLLVAHDNGGLRLFDVADKQNPVEIGKYLNEDIDATGAVFCNHVYRIGQHAFCAMDFCGFETVDISQPAAMSGVAWLNPWNCTNQPQPFGSWLGSAGHSNEIAYDATHQVLFFSGGDSQILALDPSNPAQPRLLGAWGAPGDETGSWGVDVFGNLAAIANIHTAGFPFVSTIGGLQLLQWQFVTGAGEAPGGNQAFQVFPNPFSEKTTLQFRQTASAATLSVFNSCGQLVRQQTISGDTFVWEKGDLPGGVYWLQARLEDAALMIKKVRIME